jgi:uncharacterized protein (DUF305 family)
MRGAGREARGAGLLALTLLSACAGTSSAQRTSPARADSARRQYTEADVRFMTHMISHHAQALTMSRMAPTHGASEQVRTLAERIINGQQDEIAIMQQWLRDRGLPIPEPRSTMRMMHGGVEHEMMMPGMLTDAQLAELDAARGAEFDRLFLKYMIQHHQGAVSMVKELFSSYGAGLDDTVFKLASDVNVDQTTEIGRMQTMLLNLLIEKRSQ